MKVRTLISFKDVKEKCIRKKEDIFEISEERFEEINNSEFCNSTGKKLIELVESEETNKKIKRSKNKKKNK